MLIQWISSFLFDFDYKWEIYTPVAERKYGYYVLPVLYGDKLVGRIEVSADRRQKILTVKNIWFEEDIRKTKKMISEIEKCVRRFSRFNECSEICWQVTLSWLDPFLWKANYRPSQFICYISVIKTNSI